MIARWNRTVDRYPAYVRKVDKALDEGETIAVVGYLSNTGGIRKMVAPDAIFTVDDKYFVFVGADRKLLERLHFDIPD